MRGFVPPDPETGVSAARWAVVRAPHRRRRRFAAGLVRVMADEEAARRQAAAEPGCHAAEVLGPSKSSEGQSIYYLVRWLDAGG